MRDSSSQCPVPSMIRRTMSEKARKKAKENGQKSGKGNQTISRFMKWLRDKL